MEAASSSSITNFVQKYSVQNWLRCLAHLFSLHAYGFRKARNDRVSNKIKNQIDTVLSDRGRATAVGNKVKIRGKQDNELGS
jgi:hypothetical protein